MLGHKNGILRSSVESVREYIYVSAVDQIFK